MLELVPLVLGALVGSVTDTQYFKQVRRPSWTPPAAAFGPVWTVLYLMMGLAVARVYDSTDTTLFWIQLALNLAWTPVFFTLRRPDLAFLVIVLLLVLASWTAYEFWRVDTVAGLLLVPYCLWLVVATALNYAVIQ